MPHTWRIRCLGLLLAWQSTVRQCMSVLGRTNAPGVNNLGTPGFLLQEAEAGQTRYSAFARELLTFVTSICYFHYVWEGRQFALLTDHNPLTFALGRISEPWTARQARDLSYIAEYTSDIRHISGVSNVVADTMSRPPPRPQQSASSASKPAGPPSGLSVAALSAGTGASSSTAPALAAADVKGPPGCQLPP